MGDPTPIRLVGRRVGPTPAPEVGPRQRLAQLLGYELDEVTRHKLALLYVRFLYVIQVNPVAVLVVQRLYCVIIGA